MAKLHQYNFGFSVLYDRTEEGTKFGRPFKGPAPSILMVPTDGGAPLYLRQTEGGAFEAVPDGEREQIGAEIEAADEAKRAPK